MNEGRVNRWLHWIAIGVLWVLVVVYIALAADISHRHISESKVLSLNIKIVDSTADGHLVSSATVREWVARSGIRTVGASCSDVDLGALERLICENGFISSAAAYIDYWGDITIEVHERHPSVRLLFDGYNGYADGDGYVFPAPRSSSLYLPVITGSYQPPHGADYSGDIWDITEAKIEASKGRVVELERQKYPHFKQQLAIRDSLKRVRQMRVRQRLSESDEEFYERVVAKRREKAALRRKYHYWRGLVDEKIDKITQEQYREEALQKKLRKNYEDYIKLINFVGWIQSDAFWRSEIVQIDVRTTQAGELEVDMIPRSGDFVILFGHVGTEEQNEEKLSRLEEFYHKGFGALGWEAYSTVSVKYKGQVVCTK